VSYARRDTGAKGTIPLAEVATQVPALLETIQKDLYNKADEAFKAHRLILTEWDKVVPALNGKNVVIIPFCEEPSCEEKIKKMTKSDDHQELGPDGKLVPSMGMKSLCIPFDQVSLRGFFMHVAARCAVADRSFSTLSRRGLRKARPSASTPNATGLPSRGSCLVGATR
jgi:prolyl-tRNA synthetase